MTICNECKYYCMIENPNTAEILFICDNEQSPISNFITGVKYCEDINLKGQCAFYRKKNKDL